MSFLPSNHPSLCMYQRGSHWADFREICRGKTNSVKIWQNVGTFTWKPQYVLLLPVTLNGHKITNDMISNCFDIRGGIIHSASAPQYYVTIVLNLLVIIDINFTNAHILVFRKLHSWCRLTACLYMDLGSPSIVQLLEATKAILQTNNYVINLYMCLIFSAMWLVKGMKLIFAI